MRSWRGVSGFVGLVLSSFVFIEAGAFGQAEALPTLRKGLSEASYDASGFDNINLFNLSNNLVIPIRSDQTDGGLRMNLALTYSSNVWDFIEHLTDGTPVAENVSCLTPTPNPGQFPATCAEPRTASNAGLGFLLTPGRLIPPGLQFNDGDGYLLQLSDGSTRTFYPSLLYGHTPTPGTCYTRDGSVARLKGDANFDCRTNRSDDLTATVEMPDGSIFQFERANSFQIFELDRIEDRFGNGITFTPTGNNLAISDGYRTHTIYREFRSASGTWVIDRIELAKFGGGVATWGFEYVDLEIARSCKDGYHEAAARVWVSLLSSLERPDGAIYDFGGAAGYHTECGVSSDLPGVLKQATLPAGGKIEWTFQNVNFANFDPPYNLGPANSSVGVATKRVLGTNGQCYGVANPSGFGPCTWTYFPESFVSAGERKTTVTSPSGDQTVHWFDQKGNRTPQGDGWQYGLPMSRTQPDPAGGGRFLSQQIYDGLVSQGNLKRVVYVKYERDAVSLSTAELPQVWYDTNRRTTSQRTVFSDDGNKFAQTDWSGWNGLGNFATEATSGSFEAGNVRTVETDFLYSSANPPAVHWLPNLYSRIDATEPAPGDTARREYVFNTTTGFLECERTFKTGTARTAADVLVRYIPTAAGNVDREELYGGDRQTSLDTDGVCADGVPGALHRTITYTYEFGHRKTSQISGIPGKSLDLILDQNTGLPSTRKDVSEVPTDYTYDGLGRLLTEKPQTYQGLPAGAWTKHEYFPPTASAGYVIHSYRCSETSPSTCQFSNLPEEVLELDEFGKPFREYRAVSGGAAVRASRYDPEGRRRRITSWRNYPTPGVDAETSPATVYAGFDPFGRPTSITLPDGSLTTIVYSGVRETRTTQKVAQALDGTETNVCKKEVFDRQGRLFAVEENTAACGTPESRTEYFYDEGGRLSRVCQNGSGTNCTGGQKRLFGYDNRGFLTSEEHPEKGGTSGHGTVTYSCHDAGGNPRYRDEGESSRKLAFEHDDADRLLQVRAPSTSSCTGTLTGTLWKQFNYGTANSGSNLVKGKLQSAYRLNELSSAAFPPDAKAEVTETYTYQGRSGRASKRVTALLGTQVPSETWEITQSYDALGIIGSQSYPRCTSGAACASGPPSRTISIGYQRGWLDTIQSTVPDSTLWLQNIDYHPSGLPASIQHGGGLLESITQNANGMARPESITVTHGQEPTPFATGTYLYDGAGNVKTIGTDDFAYDRYHRLVLSRLDSLAPSQAQNYTFDIHGNITVITTNGSGINYPVLGKTNRLSSASYDYSGNLTLWNGNNYAYDRMNMMARWSSGSEAWSYVYTADDERLWSIKEGGAPGSETAYSTFTVRGLGNEVLTRHERRPGGSSTPGGGQPFECPSLPDEGLWIFCDDYETGASTNWHLTVSGGATVTDYVYRGSQLLAARSNGDDRHFGLDHLGTVRVVAEDTGLFAARHTYFPFGQEASSTSQDAEVMKFTGHERDLQSTPFASGDDLDSMHARRMSPVTGRFLSVDPILQIERAQRVPRLWNRYAYVIGNPLKFTDPSGAVLHSQQGINNWSRLTSWIKERMFGDHPSRQDGPPADESAMTDEELAEIGATREMTTNLDVAERAQEGLEEFAAVSAAAGVIAVGEIATSAAVGRIARIVMPGGVKIGEAVGRNTRVRTLPGGQEAALKMFSRMAKGGERVLDGSYPGVRLKVGEDAYIGFRASSASGPTTIDLDVPGVNIKKLKFLE